MKQLNRVMHVPTLLLVLWVMSGLSWAGEGSALFGSWEAQDRFGRSIFGTIHITPEYVEWGQQADGNRPCRTGYSMVSKARAKDYPGNEKPLVSGQRFRLYKLNLEPADCRSSTAYMQFALPTDSSPRWSEADLVTYTIDYEQRGHYRFSKGVSD